ncbi:MAG: hypothetical protein ACI8RN_001090 [Glaciecola sp.]|jgi:hypothetical protein
MSDLLVAAIGFSRSQGGLERKTLRCLYVVPAGLPAHAGITGHIPSAGHKSQCQQKGDSSPGVPSLKMGVSR